MSEFSSQVIKLRERLGVSKIEMGRKVGVSGNTITRWERGEAKPKHPETIKRLIEVANGVH